MPHQPIFFFILIVLLEFNNLFGQTYSKNGMVVCDNKIASEIGIDVLKNGGNAIDASIATAFALAVTHPQAGNIGGGGFLVYLDSSGFSTTVDFREKAPIAATSKMYLNQNGQLIAGTNHYGAKSIGVPGTVAGLHLAHQKYGSLSWQDLLSPSINLAENGFLLSWTLSQHAKRHQSGNYPTFLKHYFDNLQGIPTQHQELWIQKELANTLKLISAKGKDGFYKGKVAEEIVSFMQLNNGLITEEDLARYQAIERKPLVGKYKDFEIISMPPPSSGGVALIEMLNMIECTNLDAIEFNSSEYLHLLVEVMRRTFADRAQYLGDPDFNLNMPLDKLTSKKFAKMRFQNIDFESASISDASKFGQLYDGQDTTHISVIDKSGNSVSLTYTIEQSYGSGMGSSKLGFIFNNEMGDFNPQPGFTDSGWLIGTKPNQIESEKRMLSSMSPTIITKNKKPYLIIGSPGGRTIINTVFQTILCVLEYEMPIDKAIESLKVHHQWMPDKIVYEKNLMSADTRKLLINMGHNLEGVNNLGRLMGIINSTKQNIYIGAFDSSSPDGAAVGY